MRELITKFIESVAEGTVKVYNEFSLQHELGVFLRTQLTGYKVQFERNVSYFFPDKTRFTKREIDIAVFSPGQEELRSAIELKYPRNGQYPEQMFSFCQDLAFVEELKRAGFRETYVLIFADDRLFYEGSAHGIYGYFRGSQALHGVVRKPTGQKDVEVRLQGRYRVRWQPIVKDLRYTCNEASPQQAAGYQEENLIMMRNHGFSNSSL
jgi:hypothetical protein